MAASAGRARPREGEAPSEPRSTPAQQELRPPQNAYERPKREGEARPSRDGLRGSDREPRPPKIVRTQL